jgi:hypothetical protein
VPRWSASGQRFRKRCQSQRDKESAILFEIPERKNSPNADLRLPVSMNLLKQLIQSLPFVCTSVYESTMFASAFNLCFFGLLRVGEITSQSKGRAGKHVIHISDIKLVRKQDSVVLDDWKVISR